MEKTEMLNSIIKITKETGQGLALTIIRCASSEYAAFVDELIEEGKAELYTKHYSYLPSDEWVVPAGCYFAMKDEDTHHPGALTFIRMYLGIDDLGLGVKPIDVLRNPFSMGKYTEWLNDNEKQLIDLVNMKEIEFTPNQLDDNTKNWIKDKTWYTNNDTVESCLNQSEKVSKDDGDKKQLDLYDQLMPLYNTDKSRFVKEIEDSKIDIEKLKENIKHRNKVNNWLKTQTQTDKIQTLIN